MSPSTRAWLIGFVLLPLAAPELCAQIVIGDRPTPAAPLRPRTRGEFARAAARFTEVVALLDKPDALLEQGGMNVEDINAQAAETCERLGRVCVRARQFDRAVNAYRKAQVKDPRREQRLYYNLAD